MLTSDVTMLSYISLLDTIIIIIIIIIIIPLWCT